MASTSSPAATVAVAATNTATSSSSAASASITAPLKHALRHPKLPQCSRCFVRAADVCNKAELGEMTYKYCSKCRSRCDVCRLSGEHTPSNDSAASGAAAAGAVASTSVIEYTIYKYQRKCPACHTKQKPFDVAALHEWSKEHPEPKHGGLARTQQWDALYEEYIAHTDTDLDTAREELWTYVTDTMLRATIKAHPPPPTNKVHPEDYVSDSSHQQAADFIKWVAEYVELPCLEYDIDWDVDEIRDFVRQVARETPVYVAKQARKETVRIKADIKRSRAIIAIETDKLDALKTACSTKLAKANELAIAAGLPEPFGADYASDENDDDEKDEESSDDDDEEAEEAKDDDESEASDEDSVQVVQLRGEIEPNIQSTGEKRKAEHAAAGDESEADKRSRE